MSNSAWTIEPFERKRHERAGFDCGVDVLNDCLAIKISPYEKRDLARTYVLVEEGSITIRGYYAFSNHTVVFEALPGDQAKGSPQIDIPVVLLGRLAVDQNSHGEGLGEFLLMDALRRAEYLAARIGIQAVEVEAINEHAKQFYLKFGFTPPQDDPQHLFLPVKIIRKLRLPPL
ncbi:MAG: GNAT family N-acetyltransferase [Rhodopirellula sp. JB055]|uniref:GNAT family N-acetyltransferase n=1 Tax=Rhodopirellula sp. JB055 TaxID=3342846 RepID=UPI00370AB05F